MPPRQPNSVADALLTLGLHEARWQAVLDSAQDAIISIDRAGRITLFNRGAERIFGYRADEVLGRDVVLLMPAPYRDEHADYVDRYERTGTPQAIGRIRHVHAVRKSGEVFPIEISVSEASVGDTRIYSAIIRDVSDRVRTEAELQQLHRISQQRERLADIGAITARVVHDLGNPLAAISMQVQLLLRRIEKGAAHDQLLPTARHVQTAVERLDGIIQEFTSFAREQRLDLADVTLPALLRPLRDLWFPLASSRSIDLVLELPERDVVLHADGQKLSRVIDNLVKNAIEAIERGPGSVTIAAAPLPVSRKVRISVADTGPGVAPGIDIFALFETTKPQGTGLGLAIAKQIVVAHGGNIQFEPRSPHGAIFHIDLPTTAHEM
jgi:two-component system sensor kinase FixL